MLDIKPPKAPQDHPDRNLECQVALSDAFSELIDHTSAAGWSEQEVSSALTALSDNRMLGAAQIATVDDLLGRLKRR